MATRVELVVNDGVKIFSGALKEAGFERLPDPLFLTYASERSTHLGTAGLAISQKIQNTSSHGNAWVVVVNACVFSPEIDKRLVDIGLSSAFQTVSTGIRGLPHRTLDQLYQRHTKSVDGVRNISLEIIGILDAGFEWWCDHFDSYAECLEYLTSAQSRSTPRNALVAVALALEEGDDDRAALIAEQRLARYRLVLDPENYQSRDSQFRALLS